MTHTIMKAEDSRRCRDCHNNDAMQQYRDEGRIWVAKWDEEKKSLWLRKGVIPVPSHGKTSSLQQSLLLRSNKLNGRLFQ
jgi:hypothetical protein